MNVSAEQLLIGLNMIWLGGFTWLAKVSIAEAKEELKKTVTESACKERRGSLIEKEDSKHQALASETSHIGEQLTARLDTLEEKIKNTNERMNTNAEVFNSHVHGKSGRVERGGYE